MISLKESPLAGKTKRALNKLRRQMIKPSLLFKFAKLENVARDSAKLFGDKIPESLNHWLKSIKQNFSKKIRPLRVLDKEIQGQWHRLGVFVVNFVHISKVF